MKLVLLLNVFIDSPKTDIIIRISNIEEATE